MTRSMEMVRTIDLDHEQMLVFDGGRSGRMRVLYGATWLTQEGETFDAILHAGGDVPFTGERTVIEALGHTRVQIVEDTGHRLQPTWLRRLWHGLRETIERLQFGAGAAQALRERRRPWLNGPLSTRSCGPGASGNC